MANERYPIRIFAITPAAATASVEESVAAGQNLRIGGEELELPLGA
jgi:hypothetical protein